MVRVQNFILKATGHFLNPCTYAVPGNEYRSGAGWKEGAEWHAIAGEMECVVSGKSITQGWEGEWRVSGIVNYFTGALPSGKEKECEVRRKCNRIMIFWTDTASTKEWFM